MNFIFMSSKCSKTSSPYKSLLNLSGTLNLKKSYKYVFFSLIKIFIKNNKLKMSTPTQNKEFKLTAVPYCSSDILDYFENIIRKPKIFTDNPLVKTYVNKI